MLRFEIAQGADFCSGILSLRSMGADDGVLAGNAMGISILNSSGTTVAIFCSLSNLFVSYLCYAELVVGVDLRRLTEVLLAIHNPVTLEIDLQNNRITFSQPVRMLVVDEYAQFTGGVPGRYEFTLDFQGGFIRRGNMPFLVLDLNMTVPVQTALLDAACFCNWVWICRSDRGQAVFLFEGLLYGYVAFVFQD